VVMTDACQFDETDYNYLHRHWEALGWCYRYEHRRDGHTLVLCGDSSSTPAIDGPGTLTWYGHGDTTQPGLRSFSSIRTLASTRYAATSFDFKKPRPIAADNFTLNQQGDVPPLEVYEYNGAYGFPDQQAGQDMVRLRLEEIEAASKHFRA